MMKTIIIYVSTYQSNTLKIARSMASELSASLATTLEAEKIDLSDYDLIGLGSGINFAQHHRELLSFAKSHELKNRNIFIFSTRCRPFLGKYHQALKKFSLIKVEILSVNFPVEVLTGPVHGWQ